MARLYHFPLDPFCRRVRLALAEYGAKVDLHEVKPWKIGEDFLELNPAGQVPVFIDDDNTVTAGIEATGEYLEETRRRPDLTLLGETAAQRAEARRLIAWFDSKFHHEVGVPVLSEKIVRRFLPKEAGGGAPDMNRVRAALSDLRYHLDYIGYLAQDRKWLAGDGFSQADLAAAAHLSVLDFLGDVPWSENEAVKAWYQRIKSRPSFRPLLADTIRGMTPPGAYADLDF